MKVTNDTKNKGITLIALIITIIVMLILVAVTINMAVNGGLFEKAGKAAGETQNAVNKEQELSNGKIEIGGVLYDSIDDYINGIPSYIHNWTRTGDTFTCSHCNTTYRMGQAVDYTPAESPSKTGKLESVKVASTRKTVIAVEKLEPNITTTITAEKSGLDKYYAKEGKYPADAYVDENGTQTIEQAYPFLTTWIVLGIEDTNKDGINETLLITTLEPVGTVANLGDSKLYFYGAAAYNNGPSEINRICEELYSNSEYGKARGMTIEDVNRTLNYTPHGGEYGVHEDSQWNYYTTGNLTTKLKDLPVFSSLKANGTKTPEEPNTDNEEALGEYELNGYVYFSNGTVLANPVNSNTSAITESEHNTIFGSSTDYAYWLASRGVGADSDYADFGPGIVGGGYAYSHGGLFGSNGIEDGGSVGLRPVVSLKSKLPALRK